MIAPTTLKNASHRSLNQRRRDSMTSSPNQLSSSSNFWTCRRSSWTRNMIWVNGESWKCTSVIQEVTQSRSCAVSESCQRPGGTRHCAHSRIQLVAHVQCRTKAVLITGCWRLNTFPRMISATWCLQPNFKSCRPISNSRSWTSWLQFDTVWRLKLQYWMLWYRSKDS